MAEEVTRLSLAVDSTQVKTADAALDKFASSGAKAATSAEALEQSVRTTSAALSSAAAGAGAAATSQRALELATVKADRAYAQAATSSLRLSKAHDELESVLSAGPPTANALATALVRVEVAQAGAAASALKAKAAEEALIGAQKAREAAMRGSAEATKLTAHQSQQLGFQLNDLFVQIASGQSPVTALVQQGSQLNGTFGGMRGTLSALGTVFTATRLAIGSVVGVAAGLAFAFDKGADQSLELQRSLILTGNAAGITEGRFNQMARSIADSTKTTIGSTRETLQGLVSSGRFSGEALNQAGIAAQLMAKVTGQSNEEILKGFVSAADGVAKFAATTNRQYNFLTVAQLDYVKRLEDTGNSQKALEVVFTALNGRLSEAAGKVGALSAAYVEVKRTASDFWGFLLGIGRDTTVQDNLDEIQRKLKALDLTFLERLKNNLSGGPLVSLFDLRNDPQRETARQGLLADRAASNRTALSGAEAAAEAAANAQRQQAAAKFKDLLDDTLTQEERLAKARKSAIDLAASAGASSEETSRVLANIFEKFGGAEIRRAQLEKSLAGIRVSLQGEVSAFQDAESILDALRAAGLTSDRDFYDAKRAFIDANASAQIAALGQEIAAARNSAATTKERIDADRLMASNLAEIARIRSEAAVKGRVLSIQERAAVDGLQKAYTEARIEAELLFERLRRGGDRASLSVGLGDQQRKRVEDLAAINERFDQRKAQVDAKFRAAFGERRNDPELKAQYERELALLEEFQEKEIALYVEQADKILAAQSQWQNGATRALQNYKSEIENVSAQTEQLFTSAFRGIEDVFAAFITKGKADFKSFVNAILAELAKIAFRKAVLGMANSFSGGGADPGFQGVGAAPYARGGAFDGGSATPFAAGGVVSSPTLFKFSSGGVTRNGLMGEAGPEAIMPLRRTGDGRLGVLAAGGGGATYNINVSGDATSQTVRMIEKALATYDRQRRGRD